MDFTKRFKKALEQNPDLREKSRLEAKSALLDGKHLIKRGLSGVEYKLLNILQLAPKTYLVSKSLTQKMEALDEAMIILSTYRELLELMELREKVTLWIQFRENFFKKQLNHYFTYCSKQRKVVRQMLEGLESIIEVAEIEELLKRLLFVPFCEFSLEDLGERVHILPNIREITKLYQGELRIRFFLLEQNCDNLMLEYGGLLIEKIGIIEKSWCYLRVN
ncbi:MAG: hypothetical protein WCL30_01920 [Pseudomonadota bacterium]